MGIWEALSSSAESVKNASYTAYSAMPDVKTPIVGIAKSSYNQTCSALSTVDKTVRATEGLQRAKQSIPDKEVLGSIGLTLTHMALDQASRTYTWGFPVYRTVVQGLAKHDSKTATQKSVKEEELNELRDRLQKLEAMVSASGTHHQTPVSVSAWDDSRRAVFPCPHQKPEDVIRIFMMKGFTAADFVDRQLIPKHHKKQTGDYFP